ncbi:MAG: hypothetical protein NTV93_19190 [Verrucomicrobia bacterium]|nr:hypothetical protein [Verrucomicrobiota bacterium]
MRAQVVKDTTEKRTPKGKTEEVEYRNLSVIDQDEKGATLETFIRVSIPADTNKGGTLAGAVVILALTDLGENGFGVNARAKLESIEGQIRIEATKKAA